MVLVVKKHTIRKKTHTQQHEWTTNRVGWALGCSSCVSAGKNAKQPHLVCLICIRILTMESLHTGSRVDTVGLSNRIWDFNTEYGPLLIQIPESFLK